MELARNKLKGGLMIEHTEEIEKAKRKEDGWVGFEGFYPAPSGWRGYQSPYCHSQPNAALGFCQEIDVWQEITDWQAAFAE